MSNLNMDTARRWMALAVGVCFVAACAHSPKPDGKSIPPTPPPLSVSFHWGNTPELSTADGTFVRAVLESMRARHLTGKNTALYPGYSDAVPSNAYPVFSDEEAPLPSFGDLATEFFSVESVTTLSDGRGQAAVCRWDGGPAGDDAVFTYLRQGQSPPEHQSGPANRPVQNVFGGWKLASLHVYSRAANGHLDMSQCHLDLPDPMPASGAPGLPPHPGWPQG